VTNRGKWYCPIFQSGNCHFPSPMERSKSPSDQVGGRCFSSAYNHGHTLDVHDTADDNARDWLTSYTAHDAGRPAVSDSFTPMLTLTSCSKISMLFLSFVSDIAIFALKRDVKLQLTISQSKVGHPSTIL